LFVSEFWYGLIASSISSSLIAELQRAKRASEAPLVRKIGSGASAREARQRSTMGKKNW